MALCPNKKNPKWVSLVDELKKMHPEKDAEALAYMSFFEDPEILSNEMPHIRASEILDSRGKANIKGKVVNEIINIRRRGVKEGVKSVESLNKDFSSKFSDLFAEHPELKGDKDIAGIISEARDIKTENGFEKAQQNILDRLSKMKDKSYIETWKALEQGRAFGVKEGVKSVEAFSESVKSYLDESFGGLKNKLSKVQIEAISRKALSIGDNDKLFDRFKNYVENVIDNANYDKELKDIEKIENSAKVASKDQRIVVSSAIKGIDAELLSAAELKKYKDALSAANGKTPNPIPLIEFSEEVSHKKIEEPAEFDSVKTFEEASKSFDKINEKEIKSVDDYLSKVKEANKLVKKVNELIEMQDATDGNGRDAIDGYNDVLDYIGDSLEKFEKKNEEDIVKVKGELIGDITDTKLNDFSKVKYTSEPEKELLSKLEKVDKSFLDKMPLYDLDTFSKLIKNAREGFLDVFRVNNVLSRTNGIANGEAFSKDLGSVSKVLDTIKDYISKFEVQSYTDIPKAIGIKSALKGESKATAIDRISDSFREGLSKEQSFRKKMIDELHSIQRKNNIIVGIKNHNDRRLRIKNKRKDISGYSLHKVGVISLYIDEYMAQFNDKGKKAGAGDRDWLKNVLENPSERKKYDKPTQIILDDIYSSLPKNENGEVSPKSVFNSIFLDKEASKFLAKNEISFLKDINEWKDKNITDKQEYANNTRGVPFERLPFHVSKISIAPKGLQGDIAVVSKKSFISLQSGFGKERSIGGYKEHKAIETNIANILYSNVKSTSRDFYLQPMLQDVNNSLKYTTKSLEKNRDIQKIPIVQALGENYQASLNAQFAASDISVAIRNLTALQAVKSLFSPLKTAVELSTGAVWYPIRARTYLKGYQEYTKGAKTANNLLNMFNSSLSDHGGVSVYTQETGFTERNKIVKITNALASATENILKPSILMPKFEENFKSITGESFNRDLFNNKDKGYIEKNKEAIKEAFIPANIALQNMVGTGLKGLDRRKVRTPFFEGNRVSRSSNAGIVISQFTEYPRREFKHFIIDPMMEIYHTFSDKEESDANKLKSIGKLVAVIGTLAATNQYNTASKASQYLKAVIIGDEEKKDYYSKKIKESLEPSTLFKETAFNVAQLAGSQYGALGKMLQYSAGKAAYSYYNSKGDKENAKVIHDILKESSYYDLKSADFSTVIGEKRAKLESAAEILTTFTVGAAITNLLTSIEKEVNDIAEPNKHVLSLIANSAEIILNFSGSGLPESNLLLSYLEGKKPYYKQKSTSSTNRNKKKESPYKIRKTKD